MSKALDIGIEAQRQVADVLASMANLTEYAHRMERDYKNACDVAEHWNRQEHKVHCALWAACEILSTIPIDTGTPAAADAELVRAWWQRLTTEETEG